MDYAIQGKKGSGKSLVAIGRMRDYLQSGRPIATNIDLFLEKLLPPTSKCVVYRVPDYPKAEHLEQVGYGSMSPDEDTFGGLFLDEMAVWMNAREWQDKTRKDFLNWILHGRKYGWDCHYLIQDIELLDSQIRASACELVASCKRLDRIAIPIVTRLANQLGIKLRFPKIHVAGVRYGIQGTDLTVDRWWYRGTDLYPAYDTRQIFTADFLGSALRFPPVDEKPTRAFLKGFSVVGPYCVLPVDYWARKVPQIISGTYCLLSPWHTKGRYLGWWEMYKKVVLSALLTGLVAGAVVGWFGHAIQKPTAAKAEDTKKDALKIVAEFRDGQTAKFWLSDGSTVVNPPAYLHNDKVSRIQVEGRWINKE